MHQVVMSIGLLIALPFIMIGLVNVIARFNTPRLRTPSPLPGPIKGPFGRSRLSRGLPDRKASERALEELKPRIQTKEEELSALRAEEFRLSLETGRIRDPYRGGVTNDCVQMPAMTDDVLRGASKGKV